MGKTELTERALGIKLTNDLLSGKIKLEDNPYWLGNRGQAGLINQGLLEGGTLEDLKNYSKSASNGRVSSQISDLKKRGLIVSKTKSKNNEVVYKFENNTTYGESKEEVIATTINPSKLKEQKYIEGKPNEILVTRYERDLRAREKCIEHFGYSCSVCNFNFEKVYGEVGKDFIHVHHLKLVSTTGEGEVDPVNDLRPVCPNCHAMIHKREEPFSIEELKEIMKNF